MSDQKLDPVIEELVRSTADAAPVAPSWAEVQRERRPEKRPRRMGLLLASAVALLVVALIVFVRLQPDGGEKVETTASETDQREDPNGQFEGPEPSPAQLWEQESDPLLVVLCMARSGSELTVTIDVESPLSERVEDYESGEIAGRLTPYQLLLDEVFGLMELSPAEASAVSEQRIAFELMESARYGDGGNPTPELEERLQGYLDAVAANPVLAPDPDRCWLDTDAGATAMAAFAEGTQPTAPLRCVGVAQYRAALNAQIAQPEADLSELVFRSGVLLRLNPPDSLAELEALSGEADLAVFDEPARKAARLREVQSDLTEHRAALPDGLACPLDQ